MRQVDVKFLHSHSTIDDEEKERQRLTNGCNRFSEGIYEHVDSSKETVTVPFFSAMVDSLLICEVRTVSLNQYSRILS